MSDSNEREWRFYIIQSDIPALLPQPRELRERTI
jgi:hypothetical protein